MYAREDQKIGLRPNFHESRSRNNQDVQENVNAIGTT